MNNATLRSILLYCECSFKFSQIIHDRFRLCVTANLQVLQTVLWTQMDRNTMLLKLELHHCFVRKIVI